LLSAAHGLRAVAAVPLGLGMGWRSGRAWHERAARASARGADDALPAALDRVGACVRSGMSIERALRLVAPGTPGPLGGAFAEGLRALDVGMPRARAYDIVASRAGSPDVRRLMDALARAERV